MTANGRIVKPALRENGRGILLPGLCVDVRTTAGCAGVCPLFFPGEVFCWRGVPGSTNGCLGKPETECCIPCEVGGAAGDAGVRGTNSPGIAGPPVIGVRA